MRETQEGGKPSQVIEHRCPHCESRCVVAYGFCHCGCGGKVNVWKRNDSGRKAIRGMPFKFIAGHQRRRTTLLDSSGPFRAKGSELYLIPLTLGKVTKVSERDFKRFGAQSYHALWQEDVKGFYAARRNYHKDGTGRSEYVYLHREILGLKVGDPRRADHIDHDTLNNIHTDDDSTNNLRIASPCQSQWNQHIRKNNTSGYKGVTWNRRAHKWIATITVKRKAIHLGCFDSPSAAYGAYCKAASDLHGDFACLS